ncbi:hypothetical protein SDC9_115832 [bioreactor metagenome]|uniref:Uncharacterized protein n=1 Tax=bioreactor metagenome TaxID=1076179 RepID=A0A645BUM4_9ZZZZ
MGAGEEQPRRKAYPRHRHHPHSCRRGKDHHHRGAFPGPGEAGSEGEFRHTGTVPRPQLRRQGRGCRGRVQPGDSHGGHQPPFHRRPPCHHHGPQPHRRHDRQLPPAGQRAQPRPPEDRVAEGDGSERTGPEKRHPRPRGKGQRRSPGERLRHHRGVGDNGHSLPLHGPHGPEGKNTEDRHRLHL